MRFGINQPRSSKLAQQHHTWRPKPRSHVPIVRGLYDNLRLLDTPIVKRFSYSLLALQMGARRN
jgi:hypothetical protein